MLYLLWDLKWFCNRVMVVICGLWLVEFVVVRRLYVWLRLCFSVWRLLRSLLMVLVIVVLFVNMGFCCVCVMLLGRLSCIFLVVGRRVLVSRLSRVDLLVLLLLMMVRWLVGLMMRLMWFKMRWLVNWMEVVCSVYL